MMLRVIRRGDDLLAVPPMHPHTPRAARVKVYEAVICGQFGLAATIADIEREVIEFREHQVEDLAAVIAQIPNAPRARKTPKAA